MRRPASKALYESKIAALAKAREERRRYQVILDGKETEFWKGISAKLLDREASVERSLDEYVGLPERSVWALLEQRRVLRFVRDLVGEAENATRILDDRVGKLESEVNEMSKTVRGLD